MRELNNLRWLAVTVTQYYALQAPGKVQLSLAHKGDFFASTGYFTTPIFRHTHSIY